MEGGALTFQTVPRRLSLSGMPWKASRLRAWMLMQLPASSCFRRSTRTLSGSGTASAPMEVPLASRPPRELLERAEASEVTRVEVTEEREGPTAAADGARGCCPLLPPEASSSCRRLAWAAAAASLTCCNEVRPLDKAFSA